MFLSFLVAIAWSENLTPGAPGRRLEWYKFKCHRGGKVNLRVGFVVEPNFLAKYSSKEDCEEKLRATFRKASNVYENNFGFGLVLDHFLFPIDLLSCREDIIGVYDSYSREMLKEKPVAVWVYWTTCSLGAPGIASGTGNGCSSKGGLWAQNWDSDMILVHGIGHLLGAQRSTGKGAIMQTKHEYKGERGQFHEDHEQEMCGWVDKAKATDYCWAKSPGNPDDAGTSGDGTPPITPPSTPPGTPPSTTPGTPPSTPPSTSPSPPPSTTPSPPPITPPSTPPSTTPSPPPITPPSTPPSTTPSTPPSTTPSTPPTGGDTTTPSSDASEGMSMPVIIAIVVGVFLALVLCISICAKDVNERLSSHRPMGHTPEFVSHQSKHGSTFSSRQSAMGSTKGSTKDSTKGSTRRSTRGSTRLSTRSSARRAARPSVRSSARRAARPSARSAARPSARSAARPSVRRSSSLKGRRR